MPLVRKTSTERSSTGQGLRQQLRKQSGVNYSQLHRQEKLHEPEDGTDSPKSRQKLEIITLIHSKNRDCYECYGCCMKWLLLTQDNRVFNKI